MTKFLTYDLSVTNIEGAKITTDPKEGDNVELYIPSHISPALLVLDGSTNDYMANPMLTSEEKKLLKRFDFLAKKGIREIEGSDELKKHIMKIYNK